MAFFGCVASLMLIIISYLTGEPAYKKPRRCDGASILRDNNYLRGARRSYPDVEYVTPFFQYFRNVLVVDALILERLTEGG